jgi:hypothetical protein
LKNLSKGPRARQKQKKGGKKQNRAKAGSDQDKNAFVAAGSKELSFRRTFSVVQKGQVLRPELMFPPFLPSIPPFFFPSINSFSSSDFSSLSLSSSSALSPFLAHSQASTHNRRRPLRHSHNLLQPLCRIPSLSPLLGLDPIRRHQEGLLHHEDALDDLERRGGR